MTDLISPDVEQLLFDATTSRSRRIKNRLASIWMLGGLMILFLGVIGIYLSKMFLEIKQRPYTIIRRIYGARDDGH